MVQEPVLRFIFIIAVNGNTVLEHEMCNSSVFFFPISIVNACSMPLRVLSRDASASVIDFPSPAVTAAPIMYTLPMFEEGEGGGFSIACKMPGGGGQWSRFHNVLGVRGGVGESETVDVVFRDEGGGIAGLGLLGLWAGGLSMCCLW